MKNRFYAFLLFVMFPALVPVHGQEIRDGEALIRAMHDRYEKSWYKTLTFSQKSTTILPDGRTKSDNWFEAMMLPGKLRIDFGPPSKGNGALLVDDYLTTFRDGKIFADHASMNFLMVLGFDVYCQPDSVTINKLRNHNFDLTKMHLSTWEGEPVYVVGAARGDLKSPQFWIEKKRLLLVRLIEPREDDPTKWEDVRFFGYREASGGWVAINVELFARGKKVFTEYYSDLRPNVKLDPDIFDPAQFATKHWEE
ncbi:MAG: hypothetical protein ABSD20_14390 [Terriglobales bacterium]|jgi:hypothetical protein